MCDHVYDHVDDGSSGVRRGTVLAGAAALIAASLMSHDRTARAIGAMDGTAVRAVSAASDPDPDRSSVLPVAVAPGLAIHPRDAWGADLAPRGPIGREEPRFLLVHHTASPSAYGSARDVIRGTYSFHTSLAKGWPDVCYEFFVGRDGDVWEGRAGALAGPVVADATGGSQGWAQLVCLLGDFTAAPPTDAAVDALVGVLAWLSRRDGIDVAPGATTTFTSRGSDRWPAGTPITTPTIAAHRDMTYTSCPGNAMYSLLPSLRDRVHARRTEWEVAEQPSRSGDGLLPARRIGVVSDPTQP